MNFPYYKKDLSQFYDASNPCAFSYRNYIREHSQKNQLFALGVLISPLAITGGAAVAPEIMSSISSLAVKNIGCVGIDLASQKIVNEGNIKKVNFASFAGSLLIGNPFAGALPGSMINLSIKDGLEFNEAQTSMINYYYGTVGNLMGVAASKGFSNAFKVTTLQMEASAGTNYLADQTIKHGK